LLRDANYDVDTAEGGIAALQRVEQSGADVVITDQAMHGFSGALLARVLAETHPRLAVIVMTGYADLDRVRMQLPASASVLRKPASLADIAAAVLAVTRARPV
jgi:DNA-binding NtrC family response regulator